MHSLKLSISEIYYLSLLLKQKSLNGFPNLFEMVSKEEIQKQMDSARELLLERKILKYNSQGEFDIDNTVLKIIALCCNVKKYFVITYETETEVMYKINYYMANDTETLICEKTKENFYYEFSLSESRADLKSKLYNLFENKVSPNENLQLVTIEDKLILEVMKHKISVENLENSKDLSLEQLDLLRNISQKYGLFVLNQCVVSNEGTNQMNAYVLEENNNLWFYDKPKDNVNANLFLINKEIAEKLFSDFFK